MNQKNWQVVPAIIATAIMSFCGILIETSMNVTFPTLMKTFDTTASGVQWVTTGYLLAVTVVIPLAAYLIRNFSIRRLFLVANGFFLAGVLLDSIAPTLLILLAGRFLQGIGTGISLPLMFHIILTKAPVEKRGVMVGIGTMTTSFAPAIGPTYGGIVLTNFGWRAIFWFLIPVIFISLFLGLASIPSETTERTTRFNLKAFLFLSVALASLLFAIERLSLIWLAISSVALWFFLNSNRQHSLLNLKVLKNKSFIVLMYCVLAYQATFLGLSFILPNYLQLGLHQSSTQAGFFMFPGAILVAVLAPISGNLMDRKGAAKPIFLGLVLAVVSLFLMTIFFVTADFWLLLLINTLLMVGTGISVSNLLTVTLGQLTIEEHADGNSILNTFQQFTGAVSTTVVALIFTAGQSHVSNGVAIGGRNGVLTLLVLVSISLILFTLMNRRRTL